MKKKQKPQRDSGTAEPTCSAYSRSVLAWVRKQASKIKGFESVCHIYPRAYCIAKPAPLCAVFVVPWMDSEPQVRSPEYSSSDVVNDGVADVAVGDWCAIAYVWARDSGQKYAFKLPNTNMKVGY